MYALGPFRLDADAETLFRNGEPLPIGKRAVALLRVLVERSGMPVSKDALLQAAWSGLVVEESNLPVQIAALRKVLGQEPGGDRWIETLPRRGYRFVGPIKTGAAQDIKVAPTPLGDRASSLARSCSPERRQLTIMICNLVGSTLLSANLDPEDMRDLIAAFQKMAIDVAARFDGLVAQYLSDGVHVYFGYPAAHEHDAERAVRASLAILDAVSTLKAASLTLQARVGIATGLVVIGEQPETGARQQRVAIGDTPTLAAQLQAVAAPGEVVIAASTRRLVGGMFDCRALSATKLKVLPRPVEAWQVCGEKVGVSRFEARRAGALSPLVGRHEEIELLLRRWDQAKRGEGRIVLLSGEPGIGKSRIAETLLARLDDEPHARLRYFCSPYHQDSALFPFVEELGRAAGFARDDSSAAKLEKLETLLARTTPPDEDVALLIDLLSLPASQHRRPPNLSPQRKKERTLEALIRRLEGLARRQPIAIVFEDAHWIDPTSRELLELIVERARSLPVLVIATFRPEFRPPWTGQSQVTILTLNRLDRLDRIAMVEQIAGGKALPHEVVAQIIDSSDGVPLFVEEVTKSILESGLLHEDGDGYVLDHVLPTMAIPTSLHSSLLARLDRLEFARHVAQIGAAIGRDFSYAVLRAVSRVPEDELRAALDRLVASELVFQRGTPPEAIYSFKHALVQDAAHGSLVRSSRQQFHARIAEVLADHSPELVDNQPEVFAQHYAEAGLAERSAFFWCKAGRRSAARSAMAEAATQLQKGLDQLALLPDTREHQLQELEIRSSQGAVLFVARGHAAPETGQAYARARKLWEQLGSPSEFVQIPYGESRHHVFVGDLDLAHRLDADLLRLSRQRDDSAGLVLGHYSSGRNLMLAGRFDASRTHLEEVLAIFDESLHRSLVLQAGDDPHINSHAVLGLVLFCLGYPERALAHSGAAIAGARKLAHVPSLVSSLGYGNRLLTLMADNSLDAQAKELFAITTEQGFPFFRAQGMIDRGWNKVRDGDIAAGVSLLRSGSAAYCATGAKAWVPYHTALLATACGIAGQVQEALTLLDDALRLSETRGERWLDAELNRQKGLMLLRQGYAAAAEESYRRAHDIAREQGAKLWELRAAASLARLCCDLGRQAEARDLLAPVYSWFTEGFQTPDLKEAKALLDEMR